MIRTIATIVVILLSFASCLKTRRALQSSHEKTQLEKWSAKFLPNNEQFDQTASLIDLISEVSIKDLSGCTTVILYDIFTEDSNDLLLEKLFRDFPIPYVHGQITENYKIRTQKLLTDQHTCVNYILFLKDVMRSRTIIGDQPVNKVVIVARSSQWRVYEFLANEESRTFMNLLVIALSEKNVAAQTELPFILYTHKLYVDALGSSSHQVITSWKNGRLTRPHVKLFPKKVTKGFSGHRFLISLALQPPFVIKRGIDNNDDIQWDGIEVRMMGLLANMYNFTTDFREATGYQHLGSGIAVSQAVKTKKANIGIAGLYTTIDRIKDLDTSHLHSQDCAAFISLTSTALPRYRAILGPFHWTVWVAITMVYLFAIIPLAFSDKHTLRHLIEQPQEIENMFWYVFGTFTNCFTFANKKSWSKSDKVTTRLLIGFYWMFSIIVTACYTGSIIAFVTLPAYPATIDTPEQLLRGRYQIGTLDKGGWEYWFQNITDPVGQKLLRDVDLVPDIPSGIKNTTKAFFWPYAFLGSQAELEYIVRTNFTTLNKRALLHISSECFVPFGVGLIFNKNSLYSTIINEGVLRLVQSGLINKLKSDVQWEMMRSATGKLLAANSMGYGLKSLSVEDRALTLDDTQGMFILLALGFVMGGASLLSEWVGGCFHLCARSKRGKRRSSTDSIESNYRSHDRLTPRQKLDSLQYNSLLSNHVDAEIHEVREEEGNPESSNQENDDDVLEQIDKLFNFECVFGNKNPSTSGEHEEDIEDQDEGLGGMNNLAQIN